MTAPAATIVVCTRDRSGSLAEALKNLVNQRLPERAGEYEVLVVDDGSIDDTAKVVEQIAGDSETVVRQVNAGGEGVAHARNVGVSAARGTWIAYFDDDQRTTPTWLAELLDAAERTRADLIGGPIELTLPGGVTIGPVVRAIYGEHPTNRQRRRGITPPPAGGNRLVHRRVFERVGLHDESMTVGEDTDLVARAAAAGMVFGWAPGAVVWHLIPDGRLDPESISSYAGRAGAARARVELKQLGRWRIAASASIVAAKAGANAVAFLLAVARRSRVDILDCRTRSWLFGGYLATTLKAMFTGDPTR